MTDNIKNGASSESEYVLIIPMDDHQLLPGTSAQNFVTTEAEVIESLQIAAEIGSAVIFVPRQYLSNAQLAKTDLIDQIYDVGVLSPTAPTVRVMTNPNGSRVARVEANITKRVVFNKDFCRETEEQTSFGHVLCIPVTDLKAVVDSPSSSLTPEDQAKLLDSMTKTMAKFATTFTEKLTGNSDHGLVAVKVLSDMSKKPAFSTAFVEQSVANLMDLVGRVSNEGLDTLVDMREMREFYANFLKQTNLVTRYQIAQGMFAKVQENLAVRADIYNKATVATQQEFSKDQAEYRARAKIKQIQAESQRMIKQIKDEAGIDDADLGELEEDDIKKLEASGLTAENGSEMYKEVISEMKRLKKSGGQEAAAIERWLDYVLALPWQREVIKPVDIKKAKKVLDDSHYGMDAVKKSVLKYLSEDEFARTRGITASEAKILCLDGPPGVGKTSIGSAIAEATGRKFVRVALGGVGDEADIRGHRPTYVGAMAGRIIDAMKKAGTTNPVILLDEVDKLSPGGHRGDPAAALLEALDPEQNNEFHDHFLKAGYNLRDVIFVATSNEKDRIAGPLLDRMELVKLAGYDDNEKLLIAKNHLLPKILKDKGMTSEELKISDEAMTAIITGYTRESGVRGLQKVLKKVRGHAIEGILSGDFASVDVKNADDVVKILGKSPVRPQTISDVDLVGEVNGLYYSTGGGGILPVQASNLLRPFAVDTPEDGNMTYTITGMAQEVMSESVSVALDAVRALLPRISGFNPKNDEGRKKFVETFGRSEFHIHFPDGATPKDGPSAGLAIATAIVSEITGIPVRRDIAMTGEIDMKGNALPIGGVREKLDGARKAGVKTVFIPHANIADVEKVPEKIKEGLEIIIVKHVSEILEQALSRSPFEPKAANEQIVPPSARGNGVDKRREATRGLNLRG